MRLTRPTFRLASPLGNASFFHDIGQKSEPGAKELMKNFKDSQTTTLFDENGKPSEFALSSFLCLPQNFGTIYLGETFSSYISVHNHSSEACRQILVKADLQTATQRPTLCGGNGEIVKELLPGKSIDDLVHHEVKELGAHILVCSVSYQNEAGEKMYFRKFFKFQVLKPLDIRTKFHTADDGFFFEATLMNTTKSGMLMEHVSFEPAANFQVVDMNPSTKLLENAVALRPDAVEQYLFYVFPKVAKPRIYPSNLTEGSKANVSVTVGKLDIVWRAAMGERGRLQTSQLQKNIPESSEIALEIVSLPASVLLEEQFSLNLKIFNFSDKILKLKTVLNEDDANETGLYWCCESNVKLPDLNAKSYIPLGLTLVPIYAGLQVLNGLTLVDSENNKLFEFKNLTQVLVLSK